jgi:3-phenylpropionate/trans-cinnamate dioxygenase ferredoxin reductase component
MTTFVIVGAGQAGLQAAQTLRQSGFDGRIMMVGDEPHLPYQRPPLSKKYLAGEVPRDRILLQPERFFSENAIECVLGTRADKLDPAASRLTLSNGATLDYDKLLLTLGSRCRTLPVPGSQDERIRSIRTICDVDALAELTRAGQRLIIIGGGYIGLEVAAMTRSMGLQVRVVEAGDRVMARATSEPVSAYFANLHLSNGVELELNAQVRGIHSSEHGLIVETRTGHFEGDVVLVGIGGMANSELARNAGLAVADGIVVDAFCRTSAPNIFAAGDCTSFPSAKYGSRLRLESVQNAIEQARAAAHSMLGKGDAYDPVPWFWSDQYQTKLQIAGLSQGADQTILRGDPETDAFSVCYLRAGRLIALDAINQPREYMAARRIVPAAGSVNTDLLRSAGASLKDIVMSEPVEDLT